MNQIASSENASTDAATIEGRAGSASFILTSHEFEHSGANLKLLRPALRAGDEVIVLTASEPVRPPEASWFRVVSVPGASDFTLRSHIPAVCRNEWVVLLEDHALVNKRTLDAILEVIRNKPKADLVVFLGKNLTSVSRWGWAIFLHVFALVWAPLQGPPPFSPVTSAVVRRSKLRSDARLAQGAWELQIIPRIFNSGKIEHSNDIFINHVKPMSLGSALRLGYHNARAGAALQRDLAIPARNVLYEGWYAFAPRPRLIAKALRERMDELPAGTIWRLHVVGFTHLVGNFVGCYLGGGRSAEIASGL